MSLTQVDNAQNPKRQPGQVQAQPNSRLLQYLPAIFSMPAPEVEEPFLGRFLRPFEQVWDGFEDVLATLDDRFSPALAPASDFLPWLATWVALVIDEDLDEDKHRRLLAEAVDLYRWRSTTRGVKRYLEIYTGLPQDTIEIHGAAWPAGMQIGVSSQIGAFRPIRDDCQSNGDNTAPHRIQRVDAHEPAACYDCLVVSTSVGSPNHTEARSRQEYHRVDRVRELTIQGSHITIQRQDGNSFEYDNASVERRNDLPDRRYTLHLDGTSDEYLYRGDTRLVTESKPPYSFIVQIRESLPEIEALLASKMLSKLRAVLDEQKPAHTQYYLRLTPVSCESRRRFMQVGVRSSIGADTLLS